MHDQIKLWLSDEEKTLQSGNSLARTLYRLPLSILLSGELGSGKTTFLQGFGKGMGIQERLTSPTYALEQRYQTLQWGECLHLDLYRLTPAQAKDLLAQSAEHPGIRCIEWPERVESDVDAPRILIQLSEPLQGGRDLQITFDDLALPDRETILAWRKDVCLPSHVADHCDAVAELASHLGEHLAEQGMLLRPLALRRSAELHDLLRFLDFRPGATPIGLQDGAESPQTEKRWNELRNEFFGLSHEAACAKWLIERGFPELASIVAVHGLSLPPQHRTTIEQQVLYYADKRVRVSDVVTLEQRFEDFQQRYGHGKQSEQGVIWFAEAKAIERELFPNGTPA